MERTILVPSSVWPVSDLLLALRDEYDVVTAPFAAASSGGLDFVLAGLPDMSSPAAFVRGLGALAPLLDGSWLAGCSRPPDCLVLGRELVYHASVYPLSEQAAVDCDSLFGGGLLFYENLFRRLVPGGRTVVLRLFEPYGGRFAGGSGLLDEMTAAARGVEPPRRLPGHGPRAAPPPP